MSESQFRFPEGFLWGASTSAHQVEGQNTGSDWWAWEHSEARTQALVKQGLDPSAFLSGMATDHYRRYASDFKLMRQLHLNAYRFSLEWARIEPEEGSFSIEALTHYAAVIEELRRQGIEPIVTLHHQTNPEWFIKKYGWHHRRAPELFARYAEQVAATLGSSATWWLTLNEPKLMVLRKGPALLKNPINVVAALFHMTRAHNLAYDLLHAVNPTAKVGLAYNFQAWSAKDFYSVDEFLVRIARRFDHEWFMNRIKNKMDYIGVNYYTAYHFSFQYGIPAWRQHGGGIISDMGWEVYPEGLYHILHELGEKHKLPILITENGIADANDSRRAYFIVEHLKAIHRAIRKGANVLGYCHWSLLDNFEWEHGFTPRFGLIEVNFETQERRVRGSAKMYGHIAKTNRLPLNSAL